MKTIELSISGNHEVHGDYDKQIGKIELKNDGYFTTVKASFEVAMAKDEVESFIENLKELLGVK